MNYDWIRKGLAAPGKSQRGLAEVLGVDESAISKMLNGKRRLQVTEIPLVAQYLGVTPPKTLPVLTFDPEDERGALDNTVADAVDVVLRSRPDLKLSTLDRHQLIAEILATMRGQQAETVQPESPSKSAQLAKKKAGTR